MLNDFRSYYTYNQQKKKNILMKLMKVAAPKKSSNEFLYPEDFDGAEQYREYLFQEMQKKNTRQKPKTLTEFKKFVAKSKKPFKTP